MQTCVMNIYTVTQLASCRPICIHHNTLFLGSFRILNNNTKGKAQKCIILNVIISIVYSDVVIETIHNYQSLFKHIVCLLPLPVMPICRGLMRVVGGSKMAADSITA